MRKHLRLFLGLPLLCVSAGLITGCDNSEGDVVLRILNAEDYIYEYDGSEEAEDDDSRIAIVDEFDSQELEDNFARYKGLVKLSDYEEDDYDSRDDYLRAVLYDAFPQYRLDMIDQYELDWEERHPGQDLQIVYDTYDTNETMFNELKTGKTSYDVIIPSDYMVQKLGNLGMLHKIEDNKKDDLWSNISPYLRSSLETVKVGDKGYDDTDYCIPYMWGTLGIMYNPQYYINKCGFEDEDEVHAFFSTWDSLYDERSTGTFSIKDSVRDTSTICAIHAYGDKLRDGSMTLQEIINPLDENGIKPDWIETIKEDMLSLKANAFGFETDSGKTDMTTQKIGANLCWSGDATWAIYEASEKSKLDLYYSLPIGDPLNAGTSSDALSGSNIWFDCFCMPDNGENGQYELAEDFIEFMSQPINAQQNCYCVGYTPAVKGDDMIDYMQSMYDVRYELTDAEIAELEEGVDYVEYDLTYFFTEQDADTATLWADPDTAMRDLRAQYPRKEDLPRLGIMQDFGNGNQALLDMWETVRTNPLPTWAIILFICEGVAVIAIFGLIFTKVFKKKHFQKLRKTGKQNN